MEPAKKVPEIRKLQSDIVGTNVTDSIRQDTCVSCGRPAINFTDEISRREFSISGLCQECQDYEDNFFDDDEEEILRIEREME